MLQGTLARVMTSTPANVAVFLPFRLVCHRVTSWTRESYLVSPTVYRLHHRIILADNCLLDLKGLLVLSGATAYTFEEVMKPRDIYG